MSLWKLINARWGSGVGETDEVRIDASTNSLPTLNYAHHKIHLGDHYKAEYQDTSMNTSDTIAIVFTTPDTTVWAHWKLTAQVTGQVTIQIFKTPTLSNEGTAITPFNRNENSSNTATILVKHTPTITSNGTQIVEKWLGTTGFKSIIGEEFRADSEIILEQNTQYLVLCTAEADGIKCAIGGDWYEHTDIN